MIYGHDVFRLASPETARPLRGAEVAGRWRALDSDRRLAAIELALGHSRRAA